MRPACRIHRVIGAVDQRHRDIDHRKSQWPVLERVEHAFFHRRDVIARHHTTGDLFLEFETRAARQRLDVEHHIAELTVTAGLLLVTSTLLRAFANGLAITDRGRPGHNSNAKAIGQAFARDAQMHLPLAPYHHFMGFRIVEHRERWIFFHQLVQRLPKLDVVLAILGGGGNRKHRRMRLDAADLRRGLLA